MLLFLCSSLKNFDITNHKPVNEVWVVEKYLLKGRARILINFPSAEKSAIDKHEVESKR